MAVRFQGAIFDIDGVLVDSPHQKAWRESLREGWRAVGLLPVEKDATNGTRVIAVLANIAAWVGDNDLACQQLANVIHSRHEISYGELKLLPFWDPLRGDPCFEKIVASLAPK